MNGLRIFLLLFDSGALGKILTWHGEPNMPNGNSSEIIFFNISSLFFIYKIIIFLISYKRKSSYKWNRKC